MLLWRSRALNRASTDSTRLRRTTKKAVVTAMPTATPSSTPTKVMTTKISTTMAYSVRGSLLRLATSQSFIMRRR